MQMLLIHVKDMANPLGLRFKEREDASKAQALLLSALGKDAAVIVNDDFGQSVTVISEAILAISIIDVEQDLEAQGKVALIQQKKNAELQREAKRQQDESLVIPERGLLRLPN